MKIIFFSLPSHGHTNPLLPVARELAQRGHSVIFYSIDEFKEKIEKAGLQYRSYDASNYFDPRLSKNVSVFAKKLVDVTEKSLPTFLKEVKNENPDCVIHDTLSIWGKIIGNSLHIPTVALFTTFAFNNTIIARYPQMYLPMIAKALLKIHHGASAFITYKKICKKYNISSKGLTDFVLAKEKLNIVFTSKYFQPFGNTFDKSFIFVGPSINSRNEKADFLKKINKNKKIIYISSGTIFNDNLAFYHLCIKTFANTKYQIIMSLGHRFSVNQLGKIPPNFIVLNYIPQLDVLKKTSVFITHAGMNSISESLFFGVPMILVPEIHEQILNAVRVQELGAGIYIKKQHITSVNLLDKVAEILNNKTYYDHAKKIGETLQHAGGYIKAADEIINFVQKIK